MTGTDKAIRVLVFVFTFWGLFALGLMEFTHMCSLESRWIQLALGGVPVIPVFLWLDRSRNSFELLLRFSISIFGLFYLHRRFLSWLHSESFPRWLLTGGMEDFDRKMESMNQISKIIFKI